MLPLSLPQSSHKLNKRGSASSISQETMPEIMEDDVGNNVRDPSSSPSQPNSLESLDLEAAHPPSNEQSIRWSVTLSLAFQSLGVIYGDIGTSPLYVFSQTFSDGIQDTDDILGVLSLILYTLICVPLIKYLCIVMRANDNNNGGTTALYSLLCRSAKVGLVPNDDEAEAEVDADETEERMDSVSEMIKQKLESSTAAKAGLFLVTILGTSMVIGDGVLTPCISVLSAVGGIPSLKEDAAAGISIAILIVLFCIQRYGTDKVGFAFAPAVTLWFLFMLLTGLYNLFKYEPGVLRAFNPEYMVDYFRRNGKKGWISLGGVVLCITGVEAMFADMGHFSMRAVQISFSAVVFPALSAAYVGQASFLMKHPKQVDKAFYKSVPDPIYWPTFIAAVVASIIASQAMISGAFAIISQSLSLGCFPRVKVVHTSAKNEGQVYIPEVNYILMVACVIVTWGFKTTEKIGHAYGIAVVAVMVITTFLVTLIMLLTWKVSIWRIGIFFITYIAIDLLYLSAVLYKFTQGGYLPLGLSLVLMIIMGIWHYVYKELYVFERNNKVSTEFVRHLAKNPRIKRVPGIGLLLSELVQGIPPIFPHLIASIPSVHSVVVMVSIKSIPISRVAIEERFLFTQVEPKEFRAFLCTVRYGYDDKIEEPRVFEQQLVENLKAFIRLENSILEEKGYTEQPHEPTSLVEDELQIVQEASDQGVFYMIGEAEVVAKQDSSFLKKFVVNYAYGFLRKNSRERGKVLEIPGTRLLRVGMVYEI